MYPGLSHKDQDPISIQQRGNIMSDNQSVSISGDAHKTYAAAMRKWSGWAKSRLTFGVPATSPLASTNMADRVFTINADELVLNPNRLMRKVTPFRMRQEAILTGAMLHEAAHARYSLWRGTVKDDPTFVHSDGTEPSEATIGLALLCEEPRIEGLMYRDQYINGANGLAWTPRAMAAHIMPMTTLSEDPDQMIMDLISSWVLRAGRLHALAGLGRMNSIPSWVNEFDTLLLDALEAHCADLPAKEYGGWRVLNYLINMVQWNGDMPSDGNSAAKVFANEDEEPHTGPFMIDRARKILEVLFPETDNPPSPSGGCGACAEAAGTPGQSDDQGEGGTPGQPEAGEPGEEGQGGEGEGLTEDQQARLDTLSALLAATEAKADVETKAAATDQQGKAPEPSNEDKQPGGLLGGKGLPSDLGGHWRQPTADEREIQKGAEKFLRDLVNPTEKSTTSLSETAAATVDPAALAEWKAGGRIHAPRFFKRTRREIDNSPPVKIAVLVDVSSSMDVLQAPSAMLSWALSNAALDLRNFAGRGAQVQSCLVHWGDSVKLVQPVGGVLPGIRVVPCRQGTSAMAGALAEVERQMPGFFDAPDKPEHRLLVQFTDWFLSSMGETESRAACIRALRAGVNMVSVSPHAGVAPDLMHVHNGAIGAPGKSIVVQYDKKQPGAVWKAAAEGLR